MIAASIVERTGEVEVVGFLNDCLPVGSSIGKFRKFPVLGRTEDLPTFLRQADMHVFIAYVGLSNEQKTYQKIQALNIPPDRFLTIIDPTALIPDGYCRVGRGVMMAPYVQLSPDCEIADNCILLANSFLGHDSVLDHFAHLATNAVIGANVHVGKAVHVGSNATVRERIVIGDYSLVGAAAMVIQDVPENCIVVGNPARVLRSKEQAVNESTGNAVRSEEKGKP